jgi:hypothetical protein
MIQNYFNLLHTPTEKSQVVEPEIFVLYTEILLYLILSISYLVDILFTNSNTLYHEMVKFSDLRILYSRLTVGA